VKRGKSTFSSLHQLLLSILETPVSHGITGGSKSHFYEIYVSIVRFFDIVIIEANKILCGWWNTMLDNCFHPKYTDSQDNMSPVEDLDQKRVYNRFL
jgi:hypothetical protein